jgi:hypothetical protein
VHESKVGKAYLRGCGQSLLTGAVGAVFGVALVTMVLLLVRGGDIEPRSPRLALALALPLLFIATPIALGLLWVRLRAARLDRAFAPWGLDGRQAGAVMRSWHGEVGGRELNAWFHKGPTLELYLACRPATRGVIHRGGPLIRALADAVESRRPLSPPLPDLPGVSIYTDDEQWMRELLDTGGARQAVAALLEETPRTATVISLTPKAIRYMHRFLPLADLDAAHMRRWITELEAVAAAIDELGPSPAGLEPRRLEEWARTARGRYLNRILLAMGLVMGLVMLTLFVLSWLFIGA